MNKSTFARIIADSLTLAHWSPPEITQILKRRLPQPVHMHVDSISKDIWTHLQALYAPHPARVAQFLKHSVSFDRVFRYCSKHNVWPTLELATPKMAPVDSFAGLDVPALCTQAALADWLMITTERLAYLADPHQRHEQHGEMAINHYHYLLRPKTSGQMRLIEAPKPALKSLQRAILSGILNHVPTHPDSFGFVKGRNCLQAANRHTAEEVVVCFDLQNFFASIASGRVFGLFRCLGYPRPVARLLTAICISQTPARIRERLAPADRWAFERPHLPQGAPTSPALANLMTHGLDRRLSGLARHLGCNYSRYADDLSFSGDARIARLLRQAVPDIVVDEGFRIQPGKTRILPQSTAQRVTGIGVNAHLNLPRPAFDRLKAMIHTIDAVRITEPEFRAELLGKIQWAEALNPARGAKLRLLLERRLRKIQ